MVKLTMIGLLGHEKISERVLKVDGQNPCSIGSTHIHIRCTVCTCLCPVFAISPEAACRQAFVVR